MEASVAKTNAFQAPGPRPQAPASNSICSVSAAGTGSPGSRGLLGELQRGTSTPSEKLYR